MKRRAALALMLAACTRLRGRAPGPASYALLGAGRAFGEAHADDEAWGQDELGRLADAVQDAQAASGRKDAQSALRALSRTLFETRGFAREVEDPALGYVLLPSVLRGRRGSCVGLGTLYLALGELLGLPLEAVVRPGHFYVRLVNGVTHTNAELLRAGENMPDSWYEQRFPIAGGAAKAYARPLTLEEVLGVVGYNVGRERQRQRRLLEARRAFEYATERFPDLAEAHASLAGVLVLLGAWDQAEAEYAAAGRAYPNLPELGRSVELLRSERSRNVRQP